MWNIAMTVIRTFDPIARGLKHQNPERTERDDPIRTFDPIARGLKRITDGGNKEKSSNQNI